MQSLFANQSRILERAQLLTTRGRVSELSGLTVVAEGLPLAVGTSCVIERTCKGGDGDSWIPAEVIGFRDGRTMLMTLGDVQGVARGDAVISRSSLGLVGVGRNLLGRVVNGLGRAVDGKGAVRAEDYYDVYGVGPAALARRAIESPLGTGVRAIDAFTTLGRGQRLGLFAGTGVGKSILMGMISRYTNSDVTVVALVGERGREVGDFLRKEISEEARRKTVLVVSTSDESALMRVRAAFVATTIAEFFRDRGQDVLLLVDSVTRVAMAQRQIGLAGGEPPTTKGYPPSVFSLLPRLLERAGRTNEGSITGIYTVLVEGDDINEPISDAARGVLDGHVWLSRALANAGHYPAVAVLESISRVMPDVTDADHRDAVQSARRVLATWSDIEDLVNIGAYAKGTNPQFDLAVAMKPIVDEFLRQPRDERAGEADTRGRLSELHRRIREAEARILASQRN